MRNAWATLILNAAHLPVDIYHITKGRYIFFALMVIGLFLVLGALTYIRRNKKIPGAKIIIVNKSLQWESICSAPQTKQIETSSTSFVQITSER